MIRWRVLLVMGAACAGLAGAAAPRPTLHAAAWTAPQALGAVLASEPGQCLPAQLELGEAEAVAIGAAAFRAPLLLGGQAARSGLSCNSCHRSGHDNPAFSYPGLSGEPGTADVTSSLFSSHRGDRVFNPQPIPNLSGEKRLLKIDQSPASGKLELFILGLITEEFDGSKPTPAVLAGLASYVRALSPAACRAPVRIDLTGSLARVDTSLDLAIRAAAAGDGATARFLVSAARSEMGLIGERYPPPRLTRAAAALRRAAVSLGVIERRVADDPAGALPDLQRWRAAASSWQRPLRAAEARSLYNTNVLARWLDSGS